MNKGRHLFTSESVTEGHPDKVADQISDAVLDYVLSQDPMGRVACETMVTTGVAVVAGEITTKCHIDYQKIVRNTVESIGYTDASYGFDFKTCAVMASRRYAVAGYRHGRRYRRRRRPGTDVRLCNERISRTHAAADSSGAQTHQETGRRATGRHSELPPAGWQVPGQRGIRWSQADSHRYRRDLHSACAGSDSVSDSR